MGFYNPVDLMSKAPPRFVPACGACGLYKLCHSPKMGMDGEGRRGILIVGEAPGDNEDRQGRPFVGESGNLLRSLLLDAGIEMRRDCWLTNALICHPPRNKITKQQMIEWCRPNLDKTIETLQPRAVVLLGKTAVRSLIGRAWKEDVGAITRWVGWKIPCREPNAWLLPTWHPAFLLRSGRRGRPDDMLRREMAEHLQQLSTVKGRPWDQVPNMNRLVRRELDLEKAADLVHHFIDAGRPVAFDYETDRAKPDADDARILCCGVSDGFRTVAFPWHGEVIEAMEELLCTSGVPKIGFNIKFEDRWTIREFSRPVDHWLHDGMQAAHCLDNRRGICSLKFQAFARLGVQSYDDVLKPYMKTKNGNERNRLHSVSLDKLLLYCGTDALLEWQLAQLQMEDMKSE